MLKLTLRKGDTLHLGDDITVTILPTDRSGISVGIDAPREVEIWRESPAKDRDGTDD